ncbi:MAG: LytTR family DNA-binding domain-containing protein [Bacteroidota bacterium]
MKVIIIEDEPLAAVRMKELLLRYDADMELLGTFVGVEDSVAWLRTHAQPDLGFIDIQLSDGVSFSIFDQVDIRFPIIFTTSYDEYALDAFEVNSIDYLLKPIKYTRLVKALEKWKGLSQSSSGLSDAQLSSISSLLQQKQNPKSRFMVKSGSQLKIVKRQEIAYFYSDQKITILVNKEGRRYPIDYSLDKLVEVLDPKDFFRVNRKFIIHLDAAAKIHSYFKGRLKLELHPAVEEEVVISSERTPLFKAWLNQ